MIPLSFCTTRNSLFTFIYSIDFSKQIGKLEKRGYNDDLNIPLQTPVENIHLSCSSIIQVTVVTILTFLAIGI